MHHMNTMQVFQRVSPGVTEHHVAALLKAGVAVAQADRIAYVRKQGGCEGLVHGRFNARFLTPEGAARWLVLP